MQLLAITERQEPKGLQGAGIAHFLELRGRKVVEGCGALWHSVEGRLLVSLPHQLLLDLDSEELRRMIWKAGITGVRYPSRTAAGLPGGMYVNSDKQFDFSHLHRNFRAKVRRGLELCEVRLLERGELLSQGLQLNLETMHRHERFDPEFGSEHRWKRLVDAIYQCSVIGAMGSFVAGHLAAYAITCREDGWLHILHKMSRTADLECCPNHVLDFTITREIATDPSLKAISMGYVPLVAKEGLHDYKIRLGYSVVPHNSVVRFHPVLGPALTSRAMELLVGLARQRFPQDQRLERLSAVLGAARLSRTGISRTERDTHAVEHDRILSA
jgi:hypothetical protein